jgi:hypothetical protein
MSHLTAFKGLFLFLVIFNSYGVDSEKNYLEYNIISTPLNVATNRKRAFTQEYIQFHPLIKKCSEAPTIDKRRIKSQVIVVGKP